MDGLVIDESGRKRACATRTQNLFRHKLRVAKSKGMKVNSAKTLLLCISEARTYEVAAFIEDTEGCLIESASAMKVLGLYLSSRPNMSAQVDSICCKFRAHVWTLRHLHHRGFSKQELLQVYKSTILPCHDYCSNVFQYLLTLSQTIVLKRLQAKALKAIYGFKPSYRELMERAGLTTLRARREARELSFARKCLTSQRFVRGFPVRENVRDTRAGTSYKDFFARC